MQRAAREHDVRQHLLLPSKLTPLLPSPVNGAMRASGEEKISEEGFDSGKACTAKRTEIY